MTWTSTASISQAAAPATTDLFALLVNSSLPLDLTPAHTVILQNGDTSASLRYGDPSGVQTANGVVLGPGETVQLSMPAGTRVGISGSGGGGVSAVNVFLIGG